MEMPKANYILISNKTGTSNRKGREIYGIVVMLLHALRKRKARKLLMLYCFRS